MSRLVELSACLGLALVLHLAFALAFETPRGAEAAGSGVGDHSPPAGGEPQQITSGARGTGKTNGLAEYIAQEELARRHGYWWSPDSQKLAFVEVDETHIPIYRIMHQGKDAVSDAAQEDHRYPFAGMPNARAILSAVRKPMP